MTGAVRRKGSERSFDRDEFARAYDELVIGGVFQEQGDYYARYRSRYASLMSTSAALGGVEPLDVLEVGGGQHALLANALFGDRGTVADLAGPHLEYLSSRCMTTVHWDLLTDEQPFRESFDRVFLCEVMAHLPVPPYLYLRRLRLALRPGGVLIVSTPNLHRIRNIALLLAGREPFGRFSLPEAGTWDGRFLDFSASHLRWQLERAGFADVVVEAREFGHRASSLRARVANVALRPLTLVPHLRYNLVATAFRRRSKAEPFSIWGLVASVSEVEPLLSPVAAALCWLSAVLAGSRNSVRARTARAGCPG
jgi:2-polyprenyl-3-methyl-5-hydroxy-6-metoxy-1,4-benzoquinol methylase